MFIWRQPIMTSIDLHHHSQLMVLVSGLISAERQQAFIDHIARFLETEHQLPKEFSILFLPSPPQRLSSRELEVLRLIVEGHSNPKIAKSLHLSPNTVKTHVRSLMNKLGVDRRIQLVTAAIMFNLLNSNSTALNKAS
jgi:DNA-binding NarL/FixJ family response regulator